MLPCGQLWNAASIAGFTGRRPLALARMRLALILANNPLLELSEHPQHLKHRLARGRRGIESLLMKEHADSNVRQYRDSPGVTHDAFARVGLGDAGEFALEGGGSRPAIHPRHLGGRGDQCGVGCLRRAVDDKGGAGQRLERR